MMTQSLGALRPIPNWCNSWSFFGWASQAVGMDVCRPWSEAEINADHLEQAQYVCRNAADPAACVQEDIVRTSAVTAADKLAHPQMYKELDAASNNSTLSAWFGPDVAADIAPDFSMSGLASNPWVWAGAALLAVMILRRRY